MKIIKIEQIPFDVAFEGYYWYSNASKPVVWDNKPITKDIFTALPFIVEGNLYNESTGISINIKNIDGEYLVTQANLNDVNQENLRERNYLAHRLGNTKIKLVHYWEESEPDELLANMTTLIPVWMAFKGFVKTIKSDNNDNESL